MKKNIKSLKSSKYSFVSLSLYYSFDGWKPECPGENHPSQSLKCNIINAWLMKCERRQMLSTSRGWIDHWESKYQPTENFSLILPLIAELQSGGSNVAWWSSFQRPPEAARKGCPSCPLVPVDIKTLNTWAWARERSSPGWGRRRWRPWSLLCLRSFFCCQSSFLLRMTKTTKNN